MSPPDPGTIAACGQGAGAEPRRERLVVEGAVQGVGFRPFVYRLARAHGLAGHVQNTPAGAIIEVEGAAGTLDAFRAALEARKPPNAAILRLTRLPLTCRGGRGFAIRTSTTGNEPTAPILPDLAVCPDCLAEMNDPADRRYRYPFINCTNCGPRYSIITALPYDRANTTMAAFAMCAACRAEYADPENRRHHAQPIACPDCGPGLELRGPGGEALARAEAALDQAAQAVRSGKILALKGMGGFHLICDAGNGDAVARLRRRKHRPAKPFAVMYRSLQAVRQDCTVTAQEAELLSCAQAPIVLLTRAQRSQAVPGIAPGLGTLGAMLPGTPLHHLLLAELDRPVVATSGNRAGEPLCIDEDEAVSRLGGIADLFLVHDRPISGRCDDSILRVMAGQATMLRRARGYAPLPVAVGQGFAAPVLALGGHLKTTVALGLGDRVILSPHIGDLDTPEAVAAHRAAAALLCRVYKVTPQMVAHDMHPDYRSTRMAAQGGGTPVAVQHHHAHALACMGENGVRPPCLAVTWDGAGHGGDGTVWGGEVLRILPDGFERAWHLLPFPLPGGDAAALNPRRAALGVLYALEEEAAFTRDIGLPESAARVIGTALRKGINCPLTSSAGRLFDAVAALTGICADNSFEGQAAMMLEGAADARAAAAYDFSAERGTLDWRPMLRQILAAIDAGEDPGIVSARFHATMAAMIHAAAQAVGEETVLLAGGCFQNAVLLERTTDALDGAGFRVLASRQVPPNDGGLALGQAIAAAMRQTREG